MLISDAQFHINKEKYSWSSVYSATFCCRTASFIVGIQPSSDLTTNKDGCVTYFSCLVEFSLNLDKL